MQLTELVANELLIYNYTQNQPKSSLNGVTSVEIQNDDDNYRIYYVKDPYNDDIPLQQQATLAAYYNSRFFHENLATSKLDLPCGHFVKSFQIADSDADHSVFVLNYKKGLRCSELSLDELCKIAGYFAKLHSVNIHDSRKEQLWHAIKDNNMIIGEHQKNVTRHAVEVLRNSLQSEYSKYFVNPDRIMDMVETLLTSTREDEKFPVQVICHGRLTADDCFFDEKRQLVEITNWENVCFDDPARDISNLIISSASPTVRRNQFLTIFRHYYYADAVVEKSQRKYQLTDLKRLFYKHHKNALLSGIESLLQQILDPSIEEHFKQTSARRWEAALADAVELESGSLDDDDYEDVFFAK